MESRTYQQLEFPKILQALAGFAVSEAGVSSCLGLGPSADLDELAHQSRLQEQAARWSGETGYRLSPFPPLDGLFQFLDRPGEPVVDQDGLFALRQVLQQAKQARDLIGSSEGERWTELRETIIGPAWPETVWSALSRCLDPEGRLRDESSPDLLAVRRQIRQIHQTCTKKVKDFILGENLGHFLQDEFMTISSDRYVLPLKTNFKGRFQGIIHDYSQTGETCYFEPMFLVELNNRLQELKREEREEERKVLAYLTGLVRSERERVVAAYAMLVDLDVLLAKCGLAAALDARPAELRPGAAPDLRRARHPLLVLAGVDVQPLDIQLEEGQRVLIISGGNAGGKTVCLKTLGLCALMALSGLPIPADEGSVLPPWEKVLLIMGDEQSLEGHVSTFTGQIHSLSRTWDQVDEGTLYLLDEFGAGTDPTQGAALAQAVIDGLLETGATALAATHFPALKAYALATDGVRAASVLFDPSTKRPLFSLAYDQVGASIALDVAREHGLPAPILQRAEQYLLLDGSDTGAVLDRLNELAVTREQALAELRVEREKLRKKRDGLEAAFERDKKQLLDEVQGKARGVIREWKEQKIGRKQALKELSEVREKLAADGRNEGATTPSAELDWNALTTGDSVTYLPWSRKGAVVEKDDRKQRVKIDLDGVAMWVKRAEIAAADRPSPQRGGSGGMVSTAKPAAGPALRLDLRGRRADEAVSALERFLDDALLRGARDLEVVHGRGTGALRREVHEFLKRFPAVESFAVANEDRGGDGMTEVTLK